MPADHLGGAGLQNSVVPAEERWIKGRQLRPNDLRIRLAAIAGRVNELTWLVNNDNAKVNNRKDGRICSTIEVLWVEI